MPPASLAGQRTYLDQVVCENPLSGPDLGACGAINAGSIPSVSPFQAADPALAAGSPLHTLAERRLVFRGLPDFARFALPGNDNVSDPRSCRASSTLASP